MILGDVEVRKALADGRIAVVPFSESDLKGASYDFHLSPHFCIFDGQHELAIDPLKDQRHLWKSFTARADQTFILRPGGFALASSVERWTFDTNIVGRLEGKSSVARFGLIIHAAGFFDPAFGGHATLELFNPTTLPIILYPGMLIGQMSFIRVDGKVTRPYGGSDSKYQDQGAKPEPSRYFQNYPDGEVPYPRSWQEEMDRLDAKVDAALHPTVPPHIGAFRPYRHELEPDDWRERPHSFEEAMDRIDEGDPEVVGEQSVRAHDSSRTEGTLFRTRSGKVLTEADIETLADEAEVGYDVEHLIGRPVRREHKNVIDLTKSWQVLTLPVEDFLIGMTDLGTPQEIQIVGAFADDPDDPTVRTAHRDTDLPPHRDGIYTQAIADMQAGTYVEKPNVDVVGMYCLRTNDEPCYTVFYEDEAGEKVVTEVDLQAGQALIWDNRLWHGRRGPVGKRLLIRFWTTLPQPLP
jgi:dCTP deaminase